MSDWQTTSSEYVYECPFYSVRDDSIVKPDGSPGRYYVVEKSPFCAIVTLTADKRIYLIRHFRYQTGKWGWELPMGIIDEGEKPLTAAKRELQEETGLVASHWQALGPDSLDTAKGFSDETGYHFVATDVTQSDDNEQAEEGITDCRPFTKAEVDQLIKDHELVDGVTLTSLYLAEIYGYLR